MSLKNTNSQPMGRAELAFRSAFERLKSNVPQLLPKNTSITQNNVAREAGLDPSALKKARFPSLVAEIQNWIEEFGSSKPISARQAKIAQRSRNRDLRQRLEEMKSQRDHALSLLADADAYILALTIQVQRHEAVAKTSNVISLKKNPKSPV